MMTSLLSFITFDFQFEDVSLNTCLWLLERGQLGTAAHANPVRVTRCISAMVRVSQFVQGDILCLFVCLFVCFYMLY